jgi:signal transduction histidine kinase
MKVATRLASGYGVLIALLAGVLVLDDYNENVRKYLVTGEAGYAEKATEALRAFGGTLTQLRALTLSPPERQELSRLVDLWATYGWTGERVPEYADALELSSAGLPELRRQTGLLNEAAQAAMVAELERSTAAARRTMWIALFGLTIALLFSLLVAARIVRSISEPLRHLKSGTHAVAQGNFDYRLNASPKDEFSQLGADFNVMIGRLGELDQAKKDFVSHVSHELKTPLASMQEVNRLLLEELPGTLNPKQRHLVELNLKSASRLSDMISKLLKQSQIESGSLHYEFVWQDVGELVKTIIAELKGSGRAARMRSNSLPTTNRSKSRWPSVTTYLSRCDAASVHASATGRRDRDTRSYPSPTWAQESRTRRRMRCSADSIREPTAGGRTAGASAWVLRSATGS